MRLENCHSLSIFPSEIFSLIPSSASSIPAIRFHRPKNRTDITCRMQSRDIIIQFISFVPLLEWRSDDIIYSTFHANTQIEFRKMCGIRRRQKLTGCKRTISASTLSVSLCLHFHIARWTNPIIQFDFPLSGTVFGSEFRTAAATDSWLLPSPFMSCSPFIRSDLFELNFNKIDHVRDDGGNGRSSYAGR